MTLNIFKDIFIVGLFITSLMAAILYAIPKEQAFNEAIYKERCKHTAYTYCGGVYLAGGAR